MTAREGEIVDILSVASDQQIASRRLIGRIRPTDTVGLAKQGLQRLLTERLSNLICLGTLLSLDAIPAMVYP